MIPRVKIVILSNMSETFRLLPNSNHDDNCILFSNWGTIKLFELNWIRFIFISVRKLAARRTCWSTNNPSSHKGRISDCAKSELARLIKSCHRRWTKHSQLKNCTLSSNIRFSILMHFNTLMTRAYENRSGNQCSSSLIIAWIKFAYLSLMLGRNFLPFSPSRLIMPCWCIILTIFYNLTRYWYYNYSY